MRTDVVFAGSARSEAGPVSELLCRLRVVRDDLVLADKSVRVVGDRAAPGGEPRQFTEMPLVFERAFGGIGSAENPLGSAIPNVLYGSPSTGPAGFAPISWTWPARKRLLPDGSRKFLEAPIALVPDGIDAFFQASLEDMQVPILSGREIVELTALSRGAAVRTLELPNVASRAIARFDDASSFEIALLCDTLFIDADAETCSLVLRGTIPLESQSALGRMHVAVGLSVAGGPYSWCDGVTSAPSARVSSAGTAVMEPDIDVVDTDLSDTAVIEIPPNGPALPFAASGAANRGDAPSPRSIPGAPWARTASSATPTSHDRRTLELHLPADASEIQPAVAPPAPPAMPDVPAPRVLPTKATWRATEAGERSVAASPRPAPTAANARASQPDVKKSIYGKFSK